MHKSTSVIEVKNLTAPPPKSGSFLHIGKPSKPGYFGVKLEDAMAMQSHRYPYVNIPIILLKLTEDILKYDGMRVST